LLPFFSLASFVVILLAAASLFWIYRTTAISTMTDVGEASNLALVENLLGGHADELTDYLRAAGDAAEPLPLSESLKSAVDVLLAQPAVVRIKLYNRQGVVVFSTKSEQIGDDQRDNPGFVGALAGVTTSKLIYRDGFNPFDSTSDEDNLLQSYLPVPWQPRHLPVGVFEIYTSVHALSYQVERGERWVLIGGGLVSLVVYALLLLVVRAASQHIDKRERQLRQRNSTLELLSARLLVAEDGEKKRIAHELHEGVLQTLGACKMQMDQVSSDLRSRQLEEGARTVLAVTGVLQEVMSEIRDIATDVRPSSLDDLGLLATLRDAVGVTRQVFPGIELSFETGLVEREIPKTLVAILFRVAKDALHGICCYAQATEIQLRLSRSGNRLRLEIVDDGVSRADEADAAVRSSLLAQSVNLVRERTVLSGGEFEIGRSEIGGSRMLCQWML
jgi:signal transduction histidine kinase